MQIKSVCMLFIKICKHITEFVGTKIVGVLVLKILNSVGRKGVQNVEFGELVKKTLKLILFCLYITF
jgi:hypothetical protein